MMSMPFTGPPPLCSDSSQTAPELETLENNKLLIEIVDKNINYFEDRDNIGSGKTWYYKIRVYNIYGNYADSNTITCQTGL